MADSRAGLYFSARAVPAPTRITSARLRSTWSSSRSAGPPSPPDRPSSSDAPSALAIMLARTQGRSGLAPGGYAYKSASSSAASRERPGSPVGTSGPVAG